MILEILTQRRSGESHRKTIMTIDWEGCTPEDIKKIASRALVYDFQVSLRKSTGGPFPTEHYVKVKDEVCTTPVIERIFAPNVEKGRCKANSTAREKGESAPKPNLTDMLKTLTEEEVRILLASI